MYDISFRETIEYDSSIIFSNKNQIAIDKLVLSNWEEHCVECSPPYCYHNCPNYKRRIDGRCVRIHNGIKKIDGINGPFGYGIKCQFRKWAKIETIFSEKNIDVEKAQKLDKINRFISSLCKTSWAYKLVSGVRRKWYYLTKPSINFEVDCLYINCFLVEKESVPLLVQIDDGNVLYTHIHTLKRGENSIVIKVDNIKINKGARAFLTPLQEDDTTIYFRWLDFIVESKQFDTELPADKVKVVAWDLDNTLWGGTLINDSCVKLNETAVKVIMELDKRGILNTICSKNNEREAIAKLQEFGLLDYFLYPAINWGQKSENLKLIAKELNLGINSFAFVDDNIREREEVAQALPMVRIYDETTVNKILSLAEFDVPVTETSTKRRLLYQEDAKRKVLQAQYADNYDDFLRSLNMVLTLERVDQNNKERCFELLSRSNQLNLSTNRYTKEEFEQLLSDINSMCFAFRVKDKFGDYGVVSFVSLEVKDDVATIKDLVISCRIAMKKVENSIIISLCPYLKKKNVKEVVANLIRTKKNSPLISLFDDLPFDKIEETEEIICYRMNDISAIVDEKIISINDQS